MKAESLCPIENLSGTIIDMNRKAEREYGWKRNELIGKSILSLIPTARHQRAERLRTRLRHGEEVRNWEGMRQNQQSRIFSVLLTAFPLLDETGKITSLATIAKDITLRKQMERELDETQQRLRKLSRKTIEVLENDRRTTAKELHDSIGASLAAIQFRLEGIVEEIVPDPEKARTSGWFFPSPRTHPMHHWTMKRVKFTKNRNDSLSRPSIWQNTGLCTAKYRI